MKQYCYLNGKIIPENKAAISIHDIGLLRGYALFESLRVYAGVPFLLKEHYERLKKSADLLKIKLPVNLGELSNIAVKLLNKNKLSDAALKIVLTGGESSGGFNYNFDKPTFIIFFEKLHCLSSETENGVKLITSEYSRSIPEIKSTNYLEAINRAQKLKKENAFELLYVNQGNILESQTGNFFMFLDNQLVTSKVDILHGVTRNHILKIAKDDFSVEERDIKVSELKRATECFITGSCKEIIPVVEVDNIKIGFGKVGPNTKVLIEKFAESIKNVI